ALHNGRLQERRSEENPSRAVGGLLRVKIGGARVLPPWLVCPQKRKCSSIQGTSARCQTRTFGRAEGFYSIRMPVHAFGWPSEARTKVKPVKRSRLAFESIARSENPPHGGEAKDQEQRGHRQTDADAHVSDSVETPTESTDQVHNRIQ